jgi:hypothetical protein
MAKIEVGKTIIIRKGRLRGVIGRVDTVLRNRIVIRFDVPVNGCEFAVLNPKKVGL